MDIEKVRALRAYFAALPDGAIDQGHPIAVVKPGTEYYCGCFGAHSALYHTGEPESFRIGEYLNDAIGMERTMLIQALDAVLDWDTYPFELPLFMFFTPYGVEDWTVRPEVVLDHIIEQYEGGNDGLSK